jgi:hypothetical protein
VLLAAAAAAAAVHHDIGVLASSQGMLHWSYMLKYSMLLVHWTRYVL